MIDIDDQDKIISEIADKIQRDIIDRINSWNPNLRINYPYDQMWVVSKDILHLVDNTADPNHIMDFSRGPTPARRKAITNMLVNFLYDMGDFNPCRDCGEGGECLDDEWKEDDACSGDPYCKMLRIINHAYLNAEECMWWLEGTPPRTLSCNYEITDFDEQRALLEQYLKEAKDAWKTEHSEANIQPKTEH